MIVKDEKRDLWLYHRIQSDLQKLVKKHLYEEEFRAKK